MQRGTTTAGVSNKTQFLGNVCSGKWVSTQNRTFRGNDLNVTFLCCDIDSLHLKFSMWLVVAEILQQCKEHYYTHHHPGCQKHGYFNKLFRENDSSFTIKTYRDSV